MLLLILEVYHKTEVNTTNRVHKERRGNKLANSPDFSQESFGVSSGIALRFRLLGFENAASAIAANMVKALQKRVELICAISRVKGADAFWRDMEIVIDRNLPANDGETADSFAKDFNTLLARAREVHDKTLVRKEPLVQTQKFRDFKEAGVKGIEACEIRSIILPLLADHVLREANHYIRLLCE